MAKYLRYFAVDFDRRSLANELPFAPQFVFDLFALEFGKCISKNIVKLLVQFTADASRHLVKEELLNVLRVNVRFDETVLEETEFVQRKFFLDSILAAMRTHGAEYGWDIALVEATIDRIVQEGIVFDRDWGKPKVNPKSKQSVRWHARFYCSIELTLHLFNVHRQHLKTVRVADLPGTIGALMNACGSLVWLDETHVRTTMKNNRDYWDIDLDTAQAVFHYPRAEAGDPHGQYDLGRMYLEGHIVDQNLDLARHWFALAAANGFARANTRLANLERI